MFDNQSLVFKQIQTVFAKGKSVSMVVRKGKAIKSYRIRKKHK